MLMVDSIVEISKEEVVTQFEIQKENIFVRENLFRESGLIENMAQTCSSIVGQEIIEKENYSGKIIGFITNIKTVKIHSLPDVGETIITKAKLVSQFENICNIECKTYIGEKIIAEAEINLFIKEMVV
jgi:3-hydroxymyristoyl/3-hydroxydecanoyl-(acyl carrier protein) dehydratase